MSGGERASLDLPRALADRIVEQARRERPAECCGIIAGADGQPVEIFPIPNVERADPNRRYLMDEKAHLQTLTAIDEREWDLLAYYHSHPATGAYFSDTDVARAWPGLYLVVGMEQPDAPVFKAFMVADGKLAGETDRGLVSNVPVRIVD